MSDTLPTPALHILLALSTGPTHGYGILQAVREYSGGAVPLGPGSLYRHLARLIDGGLVAESGAPASADPRRSASYRLTSRGREALSAERQRLTALLSSLEAAERRLRKGQA